MSDQPKQAIGSITWVDLTVPDADGVRDFYTQVVGWKSTGIDMGGYKDYSMEMPELGSPTAGVCHARGVNADLPAQWLVYITVADIDASLAKCVELGGKAIREIRDLGEHGRYCVIQDPAGAVAALVQPR